MLIMLANIMILQPQSTLRITPVFSLKEKKTGEETQEKGSL